VEQEYRPMNTTQPSTQKGKTPPSVPASFLLGNIPELSRDPLAFMEYAAKTYGDVVRYRLAKYSFYLVTHPDGVQRILQDNYRNYTRNGSVIWDALKPAFGSPLIVSDGDSWFQRRRIMQPVFIHRHVAEFAATMMEKTREMLDSWAPHVDSGRPIDLSPAIGHLTLTILLNALFSVENPETIRVLGEATLTQNQDAIKRSTILFYPPLAVPTPHNLRLRAANRTLDQNIFALIEEHRRHPEAFKDLLGLLIQARDEETSEGLSDRQLRDEVASLYFAGYSTSSNTLLWALYLMANYPDAMQKLRGEIDAILGDRLPTLDDLPRMPYAQMILFETLRLYPPGWVSVRKVIEDDEILGYRIPAGSHVTISAHVVHRDPRYWNDPLKFDPDRFTPENTKGRARYEYYPFLGGPHQCLGRDFVLLEAQLVLIMIAQRYRLEVMAGHVAEPEPLVTQRMRGPLPMLVFSR
jgi:cytochrome P450